MPHRSRWYVMPLVAALAGAPLLHAGAQFVSVGAMAGASLSTFTGDRVSDVKNHTGFIVGAFVRVGALGLAVQPGIYYTTKEAEDVDFGSTGPTRKSLDYIQIPVVIRIGLPMHLYAGAGLAVGFKLGCKISVASSDSDQDCAAATETTPGPKSVEYSAILEGGIEFRHVSLGARADIGITNAVEAINSSNASNANFRTKTVSVVLAVRM